MPKIIVSYRRSDSETIAGRIRDKLVVHYGDDSVFMDIDSIPYGFDFREHVKTALLQNDILLAVMGPTWAGLDAIGHSRINDETDPVRIEVETALKRNIPVIPVLVGGAKMPSPADMPDGLKDLAFRNAAQIDAGRDFHQHMERLIRSMDRILEIKSGIADPRSAETPPLSRDPDASRKPKGTAERQRASISPLDHGAIPSNVSPLLAKYGFRFSDPEFERAFLSDYRERYYTLGQTAMAITVAGWMLFGSTALVANQGQNLISIRFYYTAAPLLLILFFGSFLRIAKQMWQWYYVLFTLVAAGLAYTSAHLLQEESWFRPEYITMAYMLGIALVGMAPILILYAVPLQSMMVALALYFVLYDLHLPEAPPLYTIFTCIFLGGMLVIGFSFSIVRERSLRREFAAAGSHTR
jgi:hypothetical protein